MRERPLSPHLQIYKPQLTTVMSILHRITGGALAVGTLLVVWGLAAGAAGEQAWNAFSAFCHSPLGILMLFGWSVALYYHLCNGIRHLVWDSVRLLDLQGAYRAGYAVLIATAFLTLITWWKVLT